MKFTFPVIDLQETGRNISLLLSTSRMTPEALGKHLGFESGRAVYKWMHGETLPTLDHLTHISRLFRVPMHKLIHVKGTSVPLSRADFVPAADLNTPQDNATKSFEAEVNLKGHDLRARLNEKNISLQTLSELLGFTTSRSISRWLAGSAKPTLDNLIAVCTLLDTTLDELVSFDQPRDREEPKSRDASSICTDCTANFVYSADSNSSLEAL